MATPPPILPDMARVIAGLERKVDSVVQSSQLARVMRVDTAQGAVQNVNVTTTRTVKYTITKTCPVGYTNLLIMCSGSCIAVNSTGVQDYIYAGMRINGVDSGETLSAVGPGLTGSATLAPQAAISVTQGQAVDTQITARTGFNTWAASATNTFTLYATYLWYR